MNIKLKFFSALILFSNFIYANQEVKETVKFRLNIGVDRCLIDDLTKCETFLKIDSKEMIISGDPNSYLEGTYEFSETVSEVPFESQVECLRLPDSYQFLIKILYPNQGKISESKFFIIVPTPREIDYTQVFGQVFQEGEYEYRPFFLFNGV
jgi:hypothetical protein